MINNDFCPVLQIKEVMIFGVHTTAPAQYYAHADRHMCNTARVCDYFKGTLTQAKACPYPDGGKCSAAFAVRSVCVYI